jgi:Zn-dependent alcohol dehydrogenase
MNGEGSDGTINTTGRPEIVEALLSSTGKKGKVVTVGAGDCALHLHTRWTPTDQCSSQPKSHITYASLS